MPSVGPLGQRVSISIAPQKAYGRIIIIIIIIITRKGSF